jgi:hypothetical protein
MTTCHAASLQQAHAFSATAAIRNPVHLSLSIAAPRARCAADVIASSNGRPPFSNT